jgi:hypothetical protein
MKVSLSGVEWWIKFMGVCGEVGLLIRSPNRMELVYGNLSELAGKLFHVSLPIRWVMEPVSSSGMIHGVGLNL